MFRRFFTKKLGESGAVPLEDCTFSVVDIETTGLFPRARDRILEIAVIRLDSNGDRLDEFVTLLDPERDLGPTHIHGISARDVIGAPRFPDIAGDIAMRLAGSVFVAHNVRFDVDFLEAEFGIIGYPLPPMAALCTMSLARRIDESLASYSLAALCGHFRVHQGEAHSALEDARATARLFCIFLEGSRRSRWSTLVDLGCRTQPAPAVVWPPLPASGRTRTRQQAAVRTEPSYLGRLVNRLPAIGARGSTETLEYVDLLNRVLEDRRVTQQEANLLLELASRWGLSAEDLRNVHNDYLSALTAAAVQDGVVTDAERRDLSQVANLLGHNDSHLKALIKAAQRGIAEGGNEISSAPFQMESLAGLSVCFTGESHCMLDGVPVSRAHAEQLASKAGLIVKKSVTRDLDILVVADPDSLSGKARKAHEYGIRIMAESVFWRSIGVDIQ